MKAIEKKVPPVVLVLIVAVLMVGVTQITPSLSLNWPLRIGLALLILGVSVVVLLLSFRAFRRVKTTLNPLQPERASSLLNSGIFACSRNPIYLAMLLWLVALAVILANVFALLGCVIFCAYLTQFQIKPEERALKERFGNEYNRYINQVRRWL